MSITLNDLVIRIIFNEKSNIKLSIAHTAQVKEIMKMFLEEISEYKDEEILEFIHKYNKKC